MPAKILIVDDEDFVRNLLTQALTPLGCEVLIAPEGESGLELFQKHAPEVTLLDLRMPVMDGLEFLRALSPEKLLQHSIIVMTGHGSDLDMEECYRLGVLSFLRKPVNLAELKGMVRRSLQLANYEASLRQVNQRLDAVLRNVPDLVWECDNQGKLTYLSPNLERLLGYLPHEMIGLPLKNFVKPEDQVRLEKALFGTQEIRQMMVSFLTVEEAICPMQLSANRVESASGGIAWVGISRDFRLMAELSEKAGQVTEGRGLRINAQLAIFEAEPEALAALPRPPAPEGLPLAPYLADSSLLAMVQFALDQKEDLPFPLELNIPDAQGHSHKFQLQLNYQAQGEVLEGQLLPVETLQQLELIGATLEKQKTTLENAVMVDEEMQKSILFDSNNLAGEILNLIKQLSPYAFPAGTTFEANSFKLFLRQKNMVEYRENLRLLSNKIHGLKGTSGFLIPSAKQLCHHLEEITRPLAELKLMLSESLAQFLKDFIFKIQEMLEQYQANPHAAFEIEDWLQKITAHLEQAQNFLGDQAPSFQEIMHQRSIDHGEIRHRKEEEYLSVSLMGYSALARQVKNLFYLLTEALSDDRLIKAGNLYNEFVDTHQQIKKVPLEMSRYERLIPSLGKEYNKQVEFLFHDNGVKADREFWNAMHEIFNHSLKNAVIHGFETPEVRQAQNKSPLGKLEVELREDTLHLYVNIRDDGQGIAIEKIVAKALEQGLITAEQSKQMSTSELLNLVFLQGVSTAERLDDNAGRGVGLNAVQEAMHKFQGTCLIESQRGQGTSWNFKFPKSNVSMTCFIVTIGEFRVAIPEDAVEAFHGYQSQAFAWLNQGQTYLHHQEIIPVLNSREVFDGQVEVSAERLRRLLILKTPRGKLGLLINDILHHATLPILALPEEYRALSVYLGATLFRNQPVLVLNAHRPFV